MSLIVDRPRDMKRQPQVERTPAPADHDLPVLAVELEPRQAPEWEKLLGQGVPPALILGAERRTTGRR